MKKRLGWAIAGIALTALIAFLNPFDLLTRQSAEFDKEAFLSIRAGDLASDVEKAQGMPLRTDQRSDCEGCKTRFFSQPPKWAFGGLECWTIDDATGFVLERYCVNEP